VLLKIFLVLWEGNTTPTDHQTTCSVATTDWAVQNTGGKLIP
jgi:hypothetical protein